MRLCQNPAASKTGPAIAGGRRLLSYLNGSHMSRPRGLNAQTFDRPTATARWASNAETTAYSYRKGDVLLGYVPGLTTAATETESGLAAISERLRQSCAVSSDPDWISQHLASIDVWRERLHTAPIPIGYGDNRHLVTVAGIHTRR